MPFKDGIYGTATPTQESSHLMTIIIVQHYINTLEVLQFNLANIVPLSVLMTSVR